MANDIIRVCGLCKYSGFEKPTSDPGDENICNVATAGSLTPRNGKFDKLDNNETPTVKAQKPCFVAFANQSGEFAQWKFEPR